MREIVAVINGVSVIVDTSDDRRYELVRGDSNFGSVYYMYRAMSVWRSLNRLYGREMADFVYNHFRKHRDLRARANIGGAIT